ncbi:PREDICTED: replication protein A 30 kDa subunit [Chinchilla lanigera]|uniref:replication protein A 30 kDa subunit n=1 Tax=Chinchilla lanigera TaxID=34839 RepID=UPI00038EFB9D|nr:PREDICTED: replication protein A 30 kDa subunit [Chinchilla lanigera]
MEKREFGSYGNISVSGGASASNNQVPEVGPGPAFKIVRSRPRIQTVLPCCTSQLLNSTLVDNVFKIRGVEIAQVSIVGVIRRAEQAPNYILYKIDDMTFKPIEARQKLGREKAKQDVTPLPVGVYAKAFGVLTSSGGATILEVLRIRVLEDMNEFTAHILEVVNAHMMLGKAQRASAEEDVPVAPPPVGDAAAVRGQCEFNSIVKEVLRVIQECPLLEGKSVPELQTELCAVSAEAIKQAVEHLTTEGHIYPTVDREHFKFAG